ncbi:MAG: ECF-type sigma factor [Acidobacteriota bacterium]
MSRGDGSERKGEDVDDVPGEVTVLLHRWQDGDPEALDELFGIVYPSLRQVAGARLRREAPGNSVQVSDLVQETYLRLVDQRRCRWQDRRHFLLIAARIMRRLMVDRAREKKALRRGGKTGPRSLDEGLDVPLPAGLEPERVLDVHDALIELKELDPVQAEIAELRILLQLTIVEVAEALDLPEGTVKRRWSSCRLWLRDRLEREGDPT